MRINYVFTGEEERDEWGRYIIPANVTHASVHPSVKIIPMDLFKRHQNIVEFICHNGVEKIERYALFECPFLKRVIMRGVKVVESDAFYDCEALTDVECRKLESIGEEAFAGCTSLSNIDLPSVKIVEGSAFHRCEELEHVAFGKDLESIGPSAFLNCPSLKRITIPLKTGIIAAADTFTRCVNLKRIDIVEVEVLQETIDALLLDKWKIDMTKEVHSINGMLPDASPGVPYFPGRNEEEGYGGKAQTIRWWIISVLDKITYYKIQHRILLNDAASTLEHAVPEDIVMKHVLPFLELPSRDNLKERSRKRQRDET